MKTKILTKYAALGLAALALAVSSNTIWAASDIIVGPTGSQTGTSGAGPDFEWQNMWGPAFVSITFDAANPPPSGDTSGSIYIQGNWTGSDADNYCIGSPGNWWGAMTFDGSQYTNIEMDIKYDTASTISPASQAHVEIGFDAGYNKQTITNLSFAPGQPVANGSWHHLSIPIPATVSGIGSVHSVAFYQWNPGPTAGTMNFWVANVVIHARVLPTPPPTVSVPTKATPGLNVFLSTAGSPYDRQSAVLRQTSGLSWVGQATPANPVTYSFIIAGYPNSVNCEAWMFLVPNPVNLDNAPDWNETNCVKIRLQGSATRGLMQFQYKVNEDHQQAMYSGGNETRGYYTNAPGSWDGVTANYLESGALGSVTNNSILGTWMIKFTSNTNITLIAPNGDQSSFIMPPYNVGYFAEQNTPGFYIYLGIQANNTDAYNQAVVYSHFAVSNTASPFSENFLTDTVLDTTNTWNTSAASGPKGVLVVPADSAFWITWTLPDSGFSLQVAPKLGDPLAWTMPTTGPLIPMNGIRAQLLASNEIPAGNTAFFQLIKRQFTQLQVLMPGETNAPNTLTGKAGTPTATTVGSQVNVTVNAVDATYHIVSSTDTIHLACTDTGASVPADAPLVNGTLTTSTLYLNDAGSWTVTAADTTNTNIPSSTSSAITVQ